MDAELEWFSGVFYYVVVPVQAVWSSQQQRSCLPFFVQLYCPSGWKREKRYLLLSPSCPRPLGLKLFELATDKVRGQKYGCKHKPPALWQSVCCIQLCRQLKFNNVHYIVGGREPEVQTHWNSSSPVIEACYVHQNEAGFKNFCILE